MDLGLLTSKAHLMWTDNNIGKGLRVHPQSWCSSRKDQGNYIARHFVNSIFNLHSSLIRQVLTTSFYE